MTMLPTCPSGRPSLCSAPRQPQLQDHHHHGEPAAILLPEGSKSGRDRASSRINSMKGWPIDEEQSPPDLASTVPSCSMLKATLSLSEKLASKRRRASVFMIEAAREVATVLNVASIGESAVVYPPRPAQGPHVDLQPSPRMSTAEYQVNEADQAPQPVSPLLRRVCHVLRRDAAMYVEIHEYPFLPLAAEWLHWPVAAVLTWVYGWGTGWRLDAVISLGIYLAGLVVSTLFGGIYRTHMASKPPQLQLALLTVADLLMILSITSTSARFALLPPEKLPFQNALRYTLCIFAVVRAPALRMTVDNSTRLLLCADEFHRGDDTCLAFPCIVKAESLSLLQMLYYTWMGATFDTIRYQKRQTEVWRLLVRAWIPAAKLMDILTDAGVAALWYRQYHAGTCSWQGVQRCDIYFRQFCALPTLPLLQIKGGFHMCSMITTWRATPGAQ